jgi:hypothetical protein
MMNIINITLYSNMFTVHQYECRSAFLEDCLIYTKFLERTVFPSSYDFGYYNDVFFNYYL